MRADRDDYRGGPARGEAPAGQHLHRCLRPLAKDPGCVPPPTPPLPCESDAGPLRALEPFEATLWISTGLAVLACLAAPVRAYASFVEPFSLRLERAGVPLPDERGVSPRSGSACSQASRPRTSASTKQAAVERLMRLRPDLIMLTGDCSRETPQPSSGSGRGCASSWAGSRPRGAPFFLDGDGSPGMARAAWPPWSSHASKPLHRESQEALAAARRIAGARPRRATPLRIRINTHAVCFPG